MSFAHWKGKKQQAATATVATLATVDHNRALKNDNPTLCVADVASVAVAVSENKQKLEPPTKRELLPKSPILGGGDSVILANSTNAQDTNNPHPKGEIKPVIPKTVRQVEPQHKSELLALLAANGHYEKSVVEKSYPQIVDGQTLERKISFNLDKYAHMVKCQQCEHLSLTGTCKRLDKRVIPEAIRECDSFKLLKSERLSIVKVTPYTATELLTHYEKPLFNHLLTCPYCHVEKAQYCLNGYAMGSVYDALLLRQGDAKLRRESLALQVDRACISGRSVFVPFKPIPF